MRPLPDGGRFDAPASAGGDKTTERTVLLHKVWGLDTSVESSNLDNYIYFLRKRLKTLDSRVAIINRRGHGYRLEYNNEE